jgi:tetratricopeptide (TPR) repeat protein
MRSAVLVVATMVLVCSVTGELSASGVRTARTRSLRLYDTGEHTEALREIEAAVERRPRSADMWYMAGAVLWEIEEYLASAGAFEKAFLHSNDAQIASRAVYNRGNCLFRCAEEVEKIDVQEAIERYGQSTRAYMRALELDPSFTSAGYNLEIARLRMQELQKRGEGENVQGSGTPGEETQDDTGDPGGDDRQPDDESGHGVVEGLYRHLYGEDAGNTMPETSGNTTAREILEEERAHQKGRTDPAGSSNFRKDDVFPPEEGDVEKGW